MKMLGLMLTFAFLMLLIFGVGFGAYTVYELVSVQWQILSKDWQAVLIIVAAMLATCTLFLSLSLRSAMKKYGFKGIGKVISYNDFLHWYSELKNNPEQVLTFDSFRRLSTQMTIWGNESISKQASLLSGLLQAGDASRDQVMEKADFLNIEIKRELGLSNVKEKNIIIL